MLVRLVDCSFTRSCTFGTFRRVNNVIDERAARRVGYGEDFLRMVAWIRLYEGFQV